MNKPLLIYPLSCHRCLNWFHFGAVTNKAPMNILARLLVDPCTRSSRIKTLLYYMVGICSVWIDTAKQFSNTHSDQQYIKVVVAPCPCQRILILAILEYKLLNNGFNLLFLDIKSYTEHFLYSYRSI